MVKLGLAVLKTFCAESKACHLLTRTRTCVRVRIRARSRPGVRGDRPRVRIRIRTRTYRPNSGDRPGVTPWRASNESNGRGKRGKTLPAYQEALDLERESAEERAGKRKKKQAAKSSRALQFEKELDERFGPQDPQKKRNPR
jgi:hypothetical protein